MQKVNRVMIKGINNRSLESNCLGAKKGGDISKSVL